jgi:DNA-binding HxlR family transcriptional regulator
MKQKLKNPAPSIMQKCPVQHTHQFIGGKWRIGILWSLRMGSRRFGQLKRDVPGISEKMLIQELKNLESLVVISRKAYPEIPPKVEYTLTTRGKTLIPLIESVVDWGYADMKEHKSTANK